MILFYRNSPKDTLCWPFPCLYCAQKLYYLRSLVSRLADNCLRSAGNVSNRREAAGHTAVSDYRCFLSAELFASRGPVDITGLIREGHISCTQ
ncbi:hypothetical protein PFLUV_G00018150 [Perca fluviatilis]|uniref:Uncharacterized protein n=1 Tax=Perca fluviatilis TaxID=8168 RepID=A0A6A5EWP5_PERFL|nr:hypothetical protein PFLUV_G00018150 [Perca fluviatilis]